MNALEIAHPEYAHLLWLVALAALAGVWAIFRRRRAQRLFVEASLLPRLARPAGWMRQVMRVALVCSTLAALTAAIMDPRWGEAEQQLGTRGIDVMVLLDASRSMLAEDVRPNRLERAKVALVQDLLPRLAGDRIGLIAFAGVAQLKCPLTNDYGFFRLVLDDVSPETVPQGGSLVGDAIRNATPGFDDAAHTQKVILLITDGEDQDSAPIEAARNLWNDKHIPIVAVALGNPREGARIPLPGPSGKYLEYQGEVVRSKAEFDQLRQIGSLSDLHGFVPVGTQDFDLGEIYQQRIVPAIAHRPELQRQRVTRPSRYHPFAVAALVLLLIESFMREGPRQGRSRPTIAVIGSPAAAGGA